MYPPSPVNEKEEFYAQASTPSESSLPDYPSPQQPHQEPHGYYGPFYGHPHHFGWGSRGFMPPPPPPHHKGHPHDPFFHEGKHHRKHKSRRMRKALIGVAAVCSGLVIFNMGRGYQFHAMREDEFHHKSVGAHHQGHYDGSHHDGHMAHGFGEGKFDHPPHPPHHEFDGEFPPPPPPPHHDFDDDHHHPPHPPHPPHHEFPPPPPPPPPHHDFPHGKHNETAPGHNETAPGHHPHGPPPHGPPPHEIGEHFDGEPHDEHHASGFADFFKFKGKKSHKGPKGESHKGQNEVEGDNIDESDSEKEEKLDDKPHGKGPRKGRKSPKGPAPSEHKKPKGEHKSSHQEQENTENDVAHALEELEFNLSHMGEQMAGL